MYGVNQIVKLYTAQNAVTGMGIQKVKVKVLILKLLRLQQVCYFKVQPIILPRRMGRDKGAQRAEITIIHG